MRNWLQTRGRAVLSFLSDLGGALAFVVLAAGLIGGAVIGAVLLALDIFPQPFFAMFVLGSMFLVAGIALHVLRGPLTPESEVVATSPADEASSEQTELESREATARDEQRLLAERRALRWVREELLDNKHRIERIGEGEPKEITRLTDKHWRECEPTLLEIEDPVPHARARDAYRRITAVRNANTLIDGDMKSAIQAVDAAASSLSAVGLGLPSTGPAS